jgi:uncharacterized spore protein YtfJ
MSEKKIKQQDNKVSSIDKLIDATFLRLKDIIDANTIIGNTIQLSDQTYIIPISSVSVGLISGGGELPGKKNAKSLNGVATTGFNITPIGFVTINNGMINYIMSNNENSQANKALETVLGLLEKFLLKSEKDNVYEE